MRKILLGFLTLQSFCAFCQPAPSHLKYFGYYLVDVGFPNTNNPAPNNNYINEVATFTNLNQMAAYFPAENLVARINLMNTLCTKPFISVQEIFYYQTDNNAPSGRHLKLYPDYLTRWNTFKTINNSAFTSSKVGAFYMVDEPKWNNVSFEDLNNVSEMIKNDYPTIPILVIEAYSQINALQVPTSVDWLGFDRYTMFNPSTNVSYLQNLADIKLKRSTLNQKIFIVIDNNWIPEYGSVGRSAANMDIVAQDYYNLASSDPDIIGLLAWVWPSGVDQPAQIGARDLPQNVKNKNIQIGTSIKANFSPCSVVLTLDTTTLDNINFILKEFALKIFPNPAKEFVTINFTLKKNSIFCIKMRDMLGKEVLTKECIVEKKGNHTFNLNTLKIQKGIYLVTVTINEQIQTEQLIIQN